MIENKKGNMMAILLVVGGLFVLVMIGIMLAIGSSTINFVADTVIPELSGLGMVGDFNATHTFDVTLAPVNIFIQNFTWVAGLIYVFGLLGLIGLAYGFRSTGDNWLIGLFFALVMILIIGCVFMSNIYEDIFSGTDEIALIMQEHVVLSYMVLYSPAIMAILAFIIGIILFSGPVEEFR